MGMLAITAMAALLAGQPQAAQERPPRAPQVDQTVPVSRGTRLAIDNFAGEVVVHTWDKESLRVQAHHDARTKVNIRAVAAGVSISASSMNGPSGSVDYDITAPAWMAMKIEGTYNFVTVEGTQADISVATVRGDIVLKGAAGAIVAKTILGEIQVEGARGQITLSSVNQGIKVTGMSGDLGVETTNGSITLARIEAARVDAATVNGNISYEGAIADNGRYRFSTHNGDVTMTVPETANATFNVRTYNGEFGTSLPLKGPDRSEVRQGKRHSYTLGTGSADVEMETFGGALRLRRAGAGRTARDQ
jgi:DUF4097 and DUF4098 domain-containing protein YvlB